MHFPPNLKVVARLKRSSKIFCYIVIVTSALVLAGWIFDIDVLKRIYAGWSAMQPVTAVCFILASFSVLFLRPNKEALGDKYNVASYIIAAIVCIVTIAELGIYFFGAQQQTESDLTMHFVSSLSFLLIAALLLLTLHKAKYYFIQLIAVIVIVLSIMVILDYLFWADDFYYFLGYKKIALLSAICFLLLSLSILFAKPEFGWMNIISSDTLGGKMIRKLLVRIILFLLGMIELQYIALQFGYINAQLGIVISTIISILLISFSIFRIAIDLAKEDIRRRQAEQDTHLINEKLEKRSTQLEASNKELERFAYITSHDLQEPLKTISNYTGIIYDKYKETLDKNTRTYLKFLREATHRLKTLVNDILQYSRIERNVTFEEADCNKIVKEVLKDLGTSITESKAKIEVDVLPVIVCSKDIKQVFKNLISNAIKYRNPANELAVKIQGSSQQDNWLFAVQDNGIGIEKEYYDRIFELFQKLHPKHRYEGSGIGLAICKKVVEIHGGKIWLESEPGKGTTFYFTISKTIKNDR